VSQLINSYRFASTAFDPLSLSPVLWLDASDASTFTFSSGVVVSQWNDKSTGGLHATQGTVGNQPDRDGTVNGLSTVTFSTGDFMAGGLPTSATDNWAMSIMWDPTGTLPGGSRVPLMVGNGASNGWGVTNIADSNLYVGWLRGGTAWHNSATVPGNAPQILTLARISGTIQCWWNGTQTNLATTSAPPAPATRYNLGSHTNNTSNTAQGALGEGIVWLSPTSQQIADVIAYLNTKWACF